MFYCNINFVKCFKSSKNFYILKLQKLHNEAPGSSYLCSTLFDTTISKVPGSLINYYIVLQPY